MHATRLLLAVIFGLFSVSPSSPEYSIQAIRYASAVNEPVSALVMGAPKDEKIEIAMVFWLIRGGGHDVLFDSGFHREVWFKYFPNTAEYMRPDEAVKLAGSADRVIPGHDALQFQRFPTVGRVAKIK